MSEANRTLVWMGRLWVAPARRRGRYGRLSRVRALLGQPEWGWHTSAPPQLSVLTIATVSSGSGRTV
jgi:hypothetical protein